MYLFKDSINIGDYMKRIAIISLLIFALLGVNLFTAKSYTCNHKYTSNCDIDCNLCGKTRTAGKHSFDSKCDNTCNKCGAIRVTINHSYDNRCDTTCNNCNKIRVVSGHNYTSNCDTTCNYCGLIRKIEHKFGTVITKATLSNNGKAVKKCAECGKVLYTDTIYRIKTIKLTAKSFEYSGKKITPSVIIKNSMGKTIKSKYYTVKYSKNRKAIGTYKVTITFRDKYKGTKVLTYKITPKSTRLTSMTSKNSAVKIKYTNQSTATGYQIEFSTLKTFKESTKIKFTKTKSNVKTIKNLTPKKKYHIRIRSYKKVNGKTYYSAWSKPKTIKVS